MKPKHIIWIISALIGVVAMAAGVAVLINRYLVPSRDDSYIECDCDPEEE